MPAPVVLSVVTDAQHTFVHLLHALGCTIAAAQAIDSDRYFLGIVCADEAAGDQHTVDIMAALFRSDRCWRRRLRLGHWHARRVEPDRLVIFWDGIEVARRTVH